ncbi:MAG: T9SS type A sorting domain-containing protein [Bacteroidota bacterium]|nr:T9SS type A sorting domain-containing protein [Bacteroidota bacterium]
MKLLSPSYRAGLVLAAFLAWLPANTLRAQAPAWQSAMASTTSAIAVANAADDNGNVYVVGYFDGMLTLGNSTLVSAGMYDVFIAKWNSAQNAFVWAQRAGGTDIDFARDVAVRGNEVYVVGNLGSQGGDFGAAQLSTAGLSDVFVTKLTDNGPSSQFSWATRAGGPGHDSVWGVAVSGSAVYLAGEFDGVGASFGPATLTSVGQSDAFVAKVLDAGNGGSFVWARQAGGSGNDAAMDVAVNGASVYVTGLSDSPTTYFGNTSFTGVGSFDAFVTRLTDAGTTADFDWIRAAGGTRSDAGMTIAVSGSNIYVGGTFRSVAIAFGSTGFINASINGLTKDVFVAKMVDAGSNTVFNWAQQLGGVDDDDIRAMAVRGSSVYLAGSFQGTMGTSPGGPSLTSLGSSDAFVAALADAGSTGRVRWVQSAGGATADIAFGVALGGNSVYVAGSLHAPASFGPMAIGGPSAIWLAYVAALNDATGLATAAPEASGALSLSPNPAHGRATIDLPALPGTATATLTVLDALGRALRTQMVPTNAPAELDLTGLAPGLYAVQVAAGAAIATQRLVVE